MKLYSYSKKKVLKSAILMYGFLLIFLLYLLLNNYTNLTLVFLIPFSSFIYFIFFYRRILSVAVYNNYIIVLRRKFMFFKYKTKIIPEKGIYQHWDYTISSRIRKDYFYSIEKNTYPIFMIKPLDSWEKETIEDLILEVLRIGIPLKGNLSESIKS